jgi:Protein of unknown function (DUF2934)
MSGASGALVRETKKESEKITVSQDAIASLAYQLWKERGSPEGSPEIDWEKAEQELTKQTS